MIVHYHIEKSAGSSFRDLCRDYFGRDATETLYGATSKSTSERVRQIVYPHGPHDNDIADRFDPLAAFLIERQPAFFSTHAIRPMRRRLPQGLTTVAFFREPIARVISHYNHWRQQGNFEGTFEEFFEQKRFCNWQAKRFSVAQMEALNFVGLTERFDESIAIINAGLGLSLKSRYTNKTPWRPSKIKRSKLAPETLARLELLNAADIELYAAVRRKFVADLEKSRTSGA